MPTPADTFDRNLFPSFIDIQSGNRLKNSRGGILSQRKIFVD
jgi:hypothetical protein